MALEPTEDPPEPKDFDEMAKQPFIWVIHFAPVASLLRGPWQMSKDGVAALLSTTDAISAIPALERIIKVSEPQWGAAAEQQRQMQQSFEPTSWVGPFPGPPPAGDPPQPQQKQPESKCSIDDEEVLLKPKDELHSRERKNSPDPPELSENERSGIEIQTVL